MPLPVDDVATLQGYLAGADFTNATTTPESLATFQGLSA
jgi:hypothetical protein